MCVCVQDRECIQCLPQHIPPPEIPLSVAILALHTLRFHHHSSARPVHSKRPFLLPQQILTCTAATGANMGRCCSGWSCIGECDCGYGAGGCFCGCCDFCCYDFEQYLWDCWSCVSVGLWAGGASEDAVEGEGTIVSE